MYISLGGNCAISNSLNENKLRKQAYPFDWCKIKLNQLCLVLENNFSGYNEVEFKKLSLNHLMIDTDNSSYVLKNRYNIQFAHEICLDKDIKLFSDKLLRRIERFKLLINPTFIRLELQNLSIIQMNRYKRLINILDRYFANYKLIIISKNPIKNDKIKWIKLNEFSSDWTYPNVNWKKIFNI